VIAPLVNTLLAHSTACALPAAKSSVGIKPATTLPDIVNFYTPYHRHDLSLEYCAASLDFASLR
jgi:hypothetical protein